MFALDTNILIYYAAGDAAVTAFILDHLQKHTVFLLPSIVIVEFFSFAKLGDSDRAVFSSLFPQLEIVPLTFDLALAAAETRRNYSLKLGDSIIAATALLTSSTLVTRNTRDFKKISELPLLSL